MKENKGFAITGILYAILVLFLLLIAFSLMILASRKVILDRLKSDVSDTLSGNVAYIGFDTDYLWVANNTTIPEFQYDLTESVIVYNKDGEAVDVPVEVTHTDFNQSVNGDYTVYYRAIVDGREVVGSRTIYVGNPWPGNFSSGDDYFWVRANGFYLLEVWGAQGGDAMYSELLPERTGGYGAYSRGVVELNANDEIYYSVGEQGMDVYAKDTTVVEYPGGYNGGGNGYSAGGSGGGATHFAVRYGTLSQLSSFQSSVLIVAGGGGGADYQIEDYCSYGGHGGGYIGNNSNVNACSGTASNENNYGIGGTQTGSVGVENSEIHYTGGFGLGGCSDCSDFIVAGGGGGFYGGVASASAGGGGGSGYINNSKLLSYGMIEKSMYCYDCRTSNEAGTLTYSISTASEDPIAGTAKMGNGHARVTELVIKSKPLPVPVG